MASGGLPPEGFGRGGRGALLLAALKNQPRRPGQISAGEPGQESSNVGSSSRAVPSFSETDKPEQPRVLGRGAYLQSILQGRGRASTATVAEQKEAPKVSGRGLALSNLLVGRGAPLNIGRGRVIPPTEIRHSPPQAVSTPVAAHGSPEQHSPPTAEMEEMSIKKYSGSSGRKLELEVNYVRLKTSQGKGIYEYHVSFNPPVDSRNMKFKLLSQPQVKEIIGNVKSFDGAKLYLPIKLRDPFVTVPANMPTDNSVVNVCFKFINACRFSDCLHLYNVLFRKIMTVLKMTQVGRNHFDPKGGIPVPQHKLEIWPGYVTAVQDFEGGIMLNCDASFRVLRTVTAFDILLEAKPARGVFKETAEKNLIGCIVLTRYNNKTYRVDDVHWDLTPSSTFKSRGEEISFLDYYKKSYDITIKDVNQPLLINRPKKKELEEEQKLICLIPELCFMTGLTDAMRNDFKVMKDVASHTRVTPNRRQFSLQKFISNINSSPEAKKVLSDWNLELDSAALSLDGRLLDSEKIFLKKINFVANREADWGRNITNANVLVPVNLENWVVVFQKRDLPKVQEFINTIKKVCPSMGINVNEPIRAVINNDRTESFLEAIKENVNPNIQIVVTIFPTPRDDRYSAVKKLCCVEMPVPSQAINLKTISQFAKLRSVCQKIALQINCKLGGELWSLHIPLDNVMVCGMDTYHDAAQRKQSVLAFVASINRTLTRWFSMTTSQKSGQELGDALKTLFLSSLRKYHQVNHKLPDKIILYRDGVGDGQLDYVAKYEVDQLTTCFKHFQADYCPALSVVVVQKRINTRMYAIENKNRESSLENPPPGSILDHTVTRKKWYDFFLVSQHVRQGTVSPTHYVIVHDSSHLKPEHMQKLAYKMTHLYYNWPGTVRVPAPCQYAHKLAYLVGQNIHKETNSSLADKLFYL